MDLSVFLQSNSYEYPIKLVLSAPAPNSRSKSQKALNDDLLRLLRNHVKAGNKRIIYSSYGSPYDCSFGEPRVTRFQVKEDGSLEAEVSSTGVSTRRRDLPTSKEQMAAKQDKLGAKAKQAIEAKKTKAKKQGYNVIRSRFASSRCKSCGRSFEVGEWIARKEGAGGVPLGEGRATRRGGWMHLDCLDL